MTRIKICGITGAADALFCAEAGADYLGFVFAESPRKISRGAASDIIKRLGNSNVLTAGVFVNESIEEVKKTAASCGLDILQLHGEESPDYCRAFSDYTVFKAFRIRKESDLNAIKDYDADAFLIDSFSEDARGGTGKILPAGIAAKASERTYRLILSGGLTPENVGEIIRSADPMGVDVSSGVESSPGIKDHAKIKQFIDAVRSAH